MNSSTEPDSGPSRAPKPLTGSERAALLCLVGHMIPASAEHAVPGADDPRIFADIVGSLGRDAEDVKKAIETIEALAGDGGTAARAPAERAQLFERFRAGYPALAGVIEAVTAQCYYRDDRVLAAIGMEARAPFPIGYEVEPGDWSLLDPVRKRGKIYREAG